MNKHHRGSFHWGRTLPSLKTAQVHEPASSDKQQCKSGGYRWGQQAASGEKPLSACQTGEVTRVQRLVGCGPLRRRLLEMGLNPGTMVRIIKYAPLKDPIECELKGYHVALRVAEAQQIIVTPLDL